MWIKRVSCRAIYGKIYIGKFVVLQLNGNFMQRTREKGFSHIHHPSQINKQLRPHHYQLKCIRRAVGKQFCVRFFSIIFTTQWRCRSAIGGSCVSDAGGNLQQHASEESWRRGMRSEKWRWNAARWKYIAQQIEFSVVCNHVTIVALIECCSFAIAIRTLQPGLSRVRF